MSYTAAKGSLGFGKQTAKGTAAAAFTYMPARSIGFNPEQAVTMVGPHIGGGAYPQEPTKTGVIVRGDCAFQVRPSGIGLLLLGLMGKVATTGIAPAAFTHVFTKNTDEFSVPWLTFQKNVADVVPEQYVDCKIATMRLDFVAEDALAATAGILGITPSILATPPTETFDATDLLICTQSGAITLTPEGGSAYGAADFITNRVSLDMANVLSDNETTIGSYYRDDITLLNRTIGVTIGTRLKSATLYKALYYDGGTAWSPTIFKGALMIEAKSAANISGVTPAAKYSLKAEVGRFVGQMMPINLADGNLIEMEIAGQVVVPASGTEPFKITLVNATASY